MKYARRILVILGIVLFVSIITGLLYYFVNQRNWMNTYLIPKGFSGWFEVMYDQKGYPPLQQDSNGYVIQIPNSRLVKTSSSFPKAKYWTILVYFVDRNGVRTEVNGEDIRGGGTGGGEIYNEKGFVKKLPDTETLFIGTAEQYSKNPKVPEFK